MDLPSCTRQDQRALPEPVAPPQLAHGLHALMSLKHIHSQMACDCILRSGNHCHMRERAQESTLVLSRKQTGHCVEHPAMHMQRIIKLAFPAFGQKHNLWLLLAAISQPMRCLFTKSAWRIFGAHLQRHAACLSHAGTSKNSHQCYKCPCKRDCSLGALYKEQS